MLSGIALIRRFLWRKLKRLEQAFEQFFLHRELHFSILFLFLCFNFLIRLENFVPFYASTRHRAVHLPWARVWPSVSDLSPAARAQILFHDLYQQGHLVISSIIISVSLHVEITIVSRIQQKLHGLQCYPFDKSNAVNPDNVIRRWRETVNYLLHQVNSLQMWRGFQIPLSGPHQPNCPHELGPWSWKRSSETKIAIKDNRRPGANDWGAQCKHWQTQRGERAAWKNNHRERWANWKIRRPTQVLWG